MIYQVISNVFKQSEMTTINSYHILNIANWYGTHSKTRISKLMLKIIIKQRNMTLRTLYNQFGFWICECTQTCGIIQKQIFDNSFFF